VLARRDGEEGVLFVADVAGKGVAASLLTASVEALAAGPLTDGLAPDAVCTRVATHLWRRTPPEKYATAFLAVVERTTGRLVYTNAGHNPALLVRRDGRVERLASNGTPLGLLPAPHYGLAETSMAPGDVLFIYTDGVTEAEDPHEDEYGLARLESVCRRTAGRPLFEVVSAVRDDLRAFAAGVPFRDDLTMVAARRTA
jgi:sigma-B regulation protein RsbU (phosphoserine phosphatase)